MSAWDAIYGALVVTALAGLQRVRARWKRGQPVFPRVRSRVYFSIRSPEDDAREPRELERVELEPVDVEIIDTSEPRMPRPMPRPIVDNFDDRPTPPTKRRR